AWLFRIATNEINRYFRKTKKTSLFSIEESRIRDLVAETGDDHIDDKVRSLINVLKEAPTQLVEILELRFFEERGFQEISYILNISESAAKMRTYRALDKLREIMVIKLRDNEQA
ncbi:MAG: sigma-70 family RNA polymerase sigma factor, partial [Cyclobacteriaceae bacterium]|nr:sigma-70 family RNA polymerase sigma factor [Cyclobacteriaceae bacterium]